MEARMFLSVDDVAEELGVSKSFAYRIMRKLNAELKEMGYVTVAGKINRRYFIERTCYGVKTKEVI